MSNPDSYSTTAGTALNVAAPGVLGNDTDANGDPFTAIKVANPAHGSVTLNANGSFAYTPTPGYSGPDSFTYKANDGKADGNTATVNIAVNPENPSPPPPADLTVVPVDGAVDVPVTTVVTVTVTVTGGTDIENVVNSNNFRLTVGSLVTLSGPDRGDGHDDVICVSNGVVNGTIGYDSGKTTATFTPECKLENGTTCTVTITPDTASQQSVLAEPMN